MGLARWRATAGPSGIGVGVFVYTIVIPVMGATLDPTATLRFTVGAVTSLPPVLPVNPTTPECSSTEQWDALLGRCVRKPTARPVPVLPPIDILDPKPDLYHTQTPVPPPPDACTPFGLVMATDGSGRCVVPRTTTERYGDTPEDIAQKAIAKARAEREAAAAASALAAAVAAQESAAVIADLRARLAAKENAVRATGGTVGAGSDSGGGGLDLPPWLDGELFGLPKLLVIGAGVLLVFMFKK